MIIAPGALRTPADAPTPRPLPKTGRPARRPGSRRRRTHRSTNPVGPGPLGQRQFPAHRDRRRLGPPGPPSRRTRRGDGIGGLGRGLAARRAGERGRRRPAGLRHGPAVAARQGRQGRPGGQGGQGGQGSQGRGGRGPRGLPGRCPAGAVGPDTLARAADPGPQPRHRGGGQPPLRRGALTPPRAPPRPPSDGGAARRAPSGSRPGPAARGVRLRGLGGRTGARRLAARGAAGGRPRGALPGARHRGQRTGRPRTLRALDGPAGPSGDEGRLRLVAGVGARGPSAQPRRPQLPGPREVLRGPARGGRRAVPPHWRALHAGPWAYPDRDAYQAFSAARGAALGSV